MKSASELFNPEHTGAGPQGSQNYSSAHGHYIGVAVLLAVALLLSAWLGFAPDSLTSSPDTLTSSTACSGFVYFWLTGGLVTLFLLTLAAKR